MEINNRSNERNTVANKVSQILDTSQFIVSSENCKMELQSSIASEFRNIKSYIDTVILTKTLKQEYWKVLEILVEDWNKSR